MTHTPIKSVEERVGELVKLNRTCGCELGWCRECAKWKGIVQIALTADRQALLSVIEEWAEERIKEQKKHFGKRSTARNDETCWLCYEDDYCTHEIKLEELQDLLTLLKTLK